MNLLETILSAQGGAGLQQMSSRFGLDDGQTRTAIDALLPMLAGAVSRNAATPDGLEGLLGALGSGRHQRYVDEPSALNDPDTLQDGNAILGHMFGSKDVSREVASRASAQTGIGADVLKQMLPLLAALLMGGLSKGAAGAGGSAQGAGGMFGSPDAGWRAGRTVRVRLRSTGRAGRRAARHAHPDARSQPRRLGTGRHSGHGGPGTEPSLRP